MELQQIAIVGTGPGHPDYLTKRALDYLEKADVVLYDCLVDEIILTAIPEKVKKERVEKTFRKNNEINILEQEILLKMLKYLNEGKRVVRIKPGDGMNYNSGGMESDFLISKGYTPELVPGIPAHLAAANLLNLNLTEINQSNGFVSFMADELKKDEHMASHLAYLLKYGSVPICLYGMRVDSFSTIKSLFQAHEICDMMPVAICCDLSLKTQKLIKTNLGECAALIEMLSNENKLPDHFVVILGKHIFKSYVDFIYEATQTNQLNCSASINN